MPKSTHRIRRLYWRVNTDLLTEAFTIRKRLFEQWQRFLLSACEKVFDEAVNDDRTIHISRLELSIKVTSEQELMEVLPELIKQQIKQQLESINWQTIPTNLLPIIWQETTAEQDQFATLLYYLRTGSVSWQSAYAETYTIASELKETCRQQQTQIVNYISNQPETVSFYFRLLQLLPEAEYLVIANALLERFSSELRVAITEFIRFVSAISNNSLSRYTKERILAATLAECSSRSQQYLTANFNRIITNIIAETGSDRRIFLRNIPDSFAILFKLQTKVDTTLNQLKILIDYLQTGAVVRQTADIANSEITANLRKIYQQQRSQLLSYLSNQPETASFYFRLLELLPEAEYLVIANAILDKFSPELRVAIAKFIRLVITTSNNSLNQSNQRQIIAAILSECYRQSEEQFSTNLSEIVDSIIPHLSLSTVEQDFARNHNLEIPNQAITVTDDEFPITVNYAGLVLLHPFISRFFEATGVKETNSNTIIDSQIARAAALLHFLATGKQEIYEYELGLIKILLGLEPETPLLVGVGLLQDGDQEEAETVLQSVINYWTVLKNTSINGLRSSFLQRSGLLRRTEKGWTLQVETQSFDMLLEYLPWTISIIKLPWMKHPIYTEWQTF